MGVREEIKIISGVVVGQTTNYTHPQSCSAFLSPTLKTNLGISESVYIYGINGKLLQVHFFLFLLYFIVLVLLFCCCFQFYVYLV